MWVPGRCTDKETPMMQVRKKKRYQVEHFSFQAAAPDTENLVLCKQRPGVLSHHGVWGLKTPRGKRQWKPCRCHTGNLYEMSPGSAQNGARFSAGWCRRSGRLKTPRSRRGWLLTNRNNPRLSRVAPLRALADRHAARFSLILRFMSSTGGEASPANL